MRPLRSPGNSRHAVGGETETPNVPQLGPRASGSDSPRGHGKLGPSAAGPAPQRVSWLGPAPTGTCPQRTPPPHSGSFQETVTSSPRPRIPLTGCTSGRDSQRWISAQALHLEWGAQSPERVPCPPGCGNGGCFPVSSRRAHPWGASGSWLDTALGLGSGLSHLRGSLRFQAIQPSSPLPAGMLADPLPSPQCQIFLLPGPAVPSTPVKALLPSESWFGLALLQGWRAGQGGPVSPRGGGLRGWGRIQYNCSHHDECQLLVRASNMPTFRPSRLPLPHLEDSAPSLWPQLLVQVTSPVRAFLPSCPLPVLFLYSPCPICLVYQLAL